MRRKGGSQVALARGSGGERGVACGVGWGSDGLWNAGGSSRAQQASGVTERAVPSFTGLRGYVGMSDAGRVTR